ncbi:glycosyltransferase [Candidatus Gracilibacteria bacterium]|jgi:hypothetical protein|nr:glycosyltransferase [Candidatus Gracilibacteria bacterium]
MSKKRISYLISTKDSLEYMKLCIRSIEKNSFYQDYEVLIYSEGSNKETNDWISSEFTNDPNARFWIKPEKWDEKYWGVGGGFRFLAEKVKTPFIILLHSDMYCGPEFDRPLIDNLKDDMIISSTRLEPDIWGNNIPEFTVRQIRPGTLGSHRNYFGDTYENFDEELFNSFSNQFTYENNKTTKKTEGAGGFALTLVTYNKNGHPDPLFSPASFEDADWIIRAQLKGINCIQTSKSLIFHFGSRTCGFPTDDFSKKSERQIKSEIENQKKWLTKWNKPFIYDSSGFFSAEGMRIIDGSNIYR